MTAPRSLTVLGLVLLIFAGSIYAKDPDPKPQPLEDSTIMTIDTGRITIEIERKVLTKYQARETVDVYINTRGSNFAGFDFKVAVNSRAVDIVDLLPGEFLNSCRWEFFNGRRVREPNDPRYPTSVWQPVGLSRMGVDSASAPLCYATDKRMSLFRIVLETSSLRGREDSVAALFFWWDDCTDNVTSGMTGADLSVSSNVNDYYPVELQKADGVFPTRLGAPIQCINPNAHVPLGRRLDFHNGGVVFQYIANVDSLAVPRPELPDADSSKP